MMDTVRFILLNCVVVCCFRAATGFLFEDDPPSVTTQLGEIQGFQITGEFDGQSYAVNEFLGIPYAEPPIGHLRFRKPERLRHFPSPLNALAHGPMCPQPFTVNESMSEDCLTLSVYVPVAHAPVSRGKSVPRKPVMIWIHGGGFFGGSSREFNAEVLSTFAGVIVVTLNYRIGPLGFFSTSDSNSAGNYGLWDQHLAIRWVHDNIVSFGGDTNNVTIFGESAGSSSVLFQTLYAGNRGLFRRAIAESGTLSAWAVTDNDSVFSSSFAFAKTLGCIDSNHAALLACMRTKSSKDIIPAVKTYPLSLDVHPSWVPVYDNDFVIDEPIRMLANAKSGSNPYSFFHEVDIMMGWNNYDGCVYFPYWMSTLNISSLNDYSVTTNQLDNVFVPKIAEMGLSTTPTTHTINMIRQKYTQTSNQASPGERLKTLADMATDAFLAAPMVRTAKAHFNTASSTYIYRFSAKPPYRSIKLPPYLDLDDNANHADDVMFVFGMKAAPGVAFPTPNQRQIRLSKAIMTMWSNFAKSGNPNTPRNVKQFYDIAWDKYEIDRPRYLEISFNMTSQSSRYGPNYPPIVFWNHMLPLDQRVF